MKLVEHFLFERMIALPLVRLAYFGGVLVILGVGLKLALWLPGIDAGGYVVLVVLALPVVLVFWRLSCEGCIILFGIYERLGEIRDRLPPPPEGRDAVAVTAVLLDRPEPNIDPARAAATPEPAPRRRMWDL